MSKQLQDKESMGHAGQVLKISFEDIDGIYCDEYSMPYEERMELRNINAIQDTYAERMSARSKENIDTSYCSDEEMAEVYKAMYAGHAIAKTQEEITKEYQDRLWKAIKEGSR